MGFGMIPPIEEPAAPANAPTERSESRRAVHLAWFDPADLVPGLCGSVAEETGAILRGVGVGTQWRRATSSDLARADEISVIFVAHSAASPTGKDRAVLGATPIEARGNRKVWVHAPQVLAAAVAGSRFRPGSLTPRDQMRFVRALARVIVHEVVHAVAPEVPHGEGVMSECLTRKLLTSDPLLIGPEVGTGLHSALDAEASRARRVGRVKPVVVAGQPGPGDRDGVNQ